MKPVLYDQNETEFLDNGIGVLADCTYCIVTEERNGIYELEMRYPVTGIHYKSIVHSAIIKAVPAPESKAQPFRIYFISAPLSGIVTIKAQHISYQLAHVPVELYAADTATAAMEGLGENAVEECPFAFHTDVTAAGSFELKEPRSARACLGGSDGSIIDVYGGELEWDGYDVYLRTARGTDRGVVLKYGKNITDIRQEKNIQNTITGIYPYWIGENDDKTEIVTLPKKTISAENADLYPYRRTVPYDFSMDFQEKPTEAQLREAAESYVKSNNLGVPDVNIAVSFVMLGQSEQYKHLKLLEAVYLCDTVRVEFEKLNVSAEAKVIKTVYNVLKKRYDKVEIGNAKSTLISTLMDQSQKTDEKIHKESSARKMALQKLADSMASAGGLYTTKAIATNGGAIFYLHDKATLAESITVVKINQAGIGVSMDGGKNYTNGFLFNGTAILQEIYTVGIDASYIKTGEILVKNTDGTVLFKVSMTTGEVLINSGTLKVGEGYIKTDGSFKLGPMESTGDDNEDVLFKRAIMVNYGIEIYGDNDDENKLSYLDFHSGDDVSSDDSEYDYTGRVHNYLDSGLVSQFHFSGYRKKTGESGTCNVNVNGNIVHTSDRRLKEEIGYLDPEESEAFLMQLKPTQFKYLQDPLKKIHKGLIYDEVEAVSGGQDLALLATFMQGKEKYGALSYTELIPDMIAMLQLLQREIEVLKNRQ